jgi:hypothetical protein
MTVVCGIGHGFIRLPDREPQAIGDHPLAFLLMRRVHEAMREVKATSVIVAGVRGFPLLVGLAGLTRELPVSVILPFDNYVATMPDAHRGLMTVLLNGASHTETLPLRRGSRELKVDRAVQASIDRCECVIKFWDKTFQHSGSAYVSYAWLKRKPAHNVWDDFVRSAEEFQL